MPSKEIQIITGDSLKELKNIPDKSIHLIVTDPPYYIDGMGDDWDKAKLDKRAKKANVVGSLPVGMKFDKEQGIQLEKFYHKVSQEALRVLKPGSFFLSFSQARLAHRMATGVENAGFEIRDQYIWQYKNKTQAKAFSQDHFVDKMDISDQEKEKIKASLGNRKTPQVKPEFESIIVAQKPKEGTHIDNWLKYETGLIDMSYKMNGKHITSILPFEKPNKESYNTHLTVKPVKLIECIVKIFSKKGQTILDPFLGSGTTAIACKNTGRKCIGIEINPEYVEIGKRRLKDSRTLFED